MPKSEKKFPIRILPVALMLAAGMSVAAADDWTQNVPTQGLGALGPASGQGPVLFYGIGGGSSDVLGHGAVLEGQAGSQANTSTLPSGRQFRVNAGYAFGAATGYITVGGSQAKAATNARLRPVVGLGMQVSLNRALQLSGEILHHDVSGGRGVSTGSGETLSLRAAFRF